MRGLAWLIIVAFAAHGAGLSRQGETAEFLVAELPGSLAHADSYVLPINDPAGIAHARRLIAEGPSTGATIATARIAPGADGINRDYFAPGAPSWSWHVTDFLGFSDTAIELCDGWPAFVEQDVNGWIHNTGGNVCFWSYTVVAEIVPVPEPSSSALLGFGVGLAGVGGLIRFRAEFSSSRETRHANA